MLTVTVPNTFFGHQIKINVVTYIESFTWHSKLPVTVNGIHQLLFKIEAADDYMLSSVNF